MPNEASALRGTCIRSRWASGAGTLLYVSGKNAVVTSLVAPATGSLTGSGAVVTGCGDAYHPGIAMPTNNAAAAARPRRFPRRHLARAIEWTSASSRASTSGEAPSRSSSAATSRRAEVSVRSLPWKFIVLFPNARRRLQRRQLRHEQRTRAMQPRSDRAHRAIDDAGGVDVGHFLQLAQHEHFPVERRQ